MAGGVSRRIELILGLVVICCFLSRSAEGVWIEIPSSGTKCVSEDIQSNVVVLADYTITNEDSSSTTIPNISARVTSPYGNNLHHQENVTHGQFAFTTTEGGNYLACFWIEGNYQASSSGATVNLNWRTGIAAKDWESVAKKDKIEGVELELRKLEELVESIHGNLVYLKGREADMREVSESTNTRVAWFSIMSISLCVLVSVLQIWYLKTYFHKKKLI